MARNNVAPENSWERQPGESEKAYEGFKAYLDMGTERSVRKVAQKLNKSLTLIGRWSSTHSWPKRARDYDNSITQAELKTQKQAAASMRKRQLQTAVLIQKKAFDALQNMDISELPPRDILRFLLEGAKWEREIAAMAAEDLQAGEQQTTASLADTIVAAYKRRREEGNDK